MLLGWIWCCWAEIPTTSPSPHGTEVLFVYTPTSEQLWRQMFALAVACTRARVRVWKVANLNLYLVSTPFTQTLCCCSASLSTTLSRTNTPSAHTVILLIKTSAATKWFQTILISNRYQSAYPQWALESLMSGGISVYSVWFIFLLFTSCGYFFKKSREIRFIRAGLCADWVKIIKHDRHRDFQVYAGRSRPTWDASLLSLEGL